MEVTSVYEPPFFLIIPHFLQTIHSRRRSTLVVNGDDEMKSNRADEMPPVMRGVPLTSADDQSHQQSRQDISSAKSRRPRRSRSKRGIARTDVKYSQICFRIEE